MSVAAENDKGTVTLEADFWREAEFFKSALDMRVGLFDALKERGLLKRLLAEDAAPFLENMTEEDAEAVLKEACDMASLWLHPRGEVTPEEGKPE